jgi:transposase InsO family protein
VSAVTARLGIGTLVEHDGARFEVVEFHGRALLLRQVGALPAGQRPGGGVRQVDIAWLLAHPTTYVHPVTVQERLDDQGSGDRVGGQACGGGELAAGTVLGGLDDAGRAELDERVGHVREVVSGYRRGSAVLALPGEPRAAYGPGTAKMDRYAAKAGEIGVGASTVRRWVAAFVASGPAGLVQDSAGPKARYVDARWVQMCRVVLAEHVTGSRPTRAIVLTEIVERLAEEHGPGTVAAPGRSVAYEVLADLDRGSNAFTGSTKGKRSIAERPQGVYGRLRATRPGEYLLLDTTRLDVFAMEAVTCRWVQAELTVAMDLYSRAITGLRLTPVSTKAVDVAGVLFETLRPRIRATGCDEDSRGHGGGIDLVGVGVPGTVVVDARRLLDAAGRPMLPPQVLPSVAAETIVYDHGKIYLSQHVESVCARFGISLQPARPHTPTDKSPLERWFRSLADGLLVALPGYKGADVHSRGLDVENEAFYFLDELEAIIRDWVGLCYHPRQHRGLCVPEVPGLAVSPLEMFAHGVHRAGYLSVAARPDLAYDFLDVAWTSVQHYGVEINGLRYNGSALNGHRNQRSPYSGVHAGKWPIALDPGDVRAVHFQDPEDRSWHRLDWEHAPGLDKPFSSEALTYARRLAGSTQRFPDVSATLVDLLQRWGAGLTHSAAERRMAARLSHQRLRLLPGTDTGLDADVMGLPSLRRLTAINTPAPTIPEPVDPVTHYSSGFTMSARS